MEINDYDILSRQTRGELLMEVHRYMATGWQPVGGVSVVVYNSASGSEYEVWSQAMVHELKVN